ncbi:MAG TPA: sialidase family protein [Mycobacteriales bacterium]|nr:sialidase family protein [Mycobacteriales bacterium]
MRRLATLVACGALLGAVVAPAGARTSSRWVTGVLPVPYATGTNYSAEPAIAASPDGTLWAASNFFNPPCANTVSGCGTDIWRSKNGGRSWTWVGNPFRNLPTTPEEGFGGYDVDIAVAPERNSAGRYNLYLTSLWTGSNSVVVSTDDGASWTLLPAVSAGFVDRPWLQAIGPCTAYLGAKDVFSDVTVFTVFDGCEGRLRPTKVASAFAPGVNTRTGRFTVDASPRSPHRGAIYYPGVAEATKRVVLSVSTDGGASWVLRDVAPFAKEAFVPIWPVTVATDALGLVHMAWHDATTSFLATSRDGGRTWSKARALHGPKHTGVYPTVAATGQGQLAVAWYGTDVAGPSDDKGNMGRPVDREDAAPWRLMITQSRDGGRTFSRAEAASGVIHRGAICVSGTGCASDGTRALLDCFGLTFDTRGRLAGVFTSGLPRKGTDRAGSNSRFVAEVR